MHNGPIHAVVTDSGDSLSELCRQLIASGISPDTSLDVYRDDGVPSFGVWTLREGVELPLGFDVSLRTDKETNMPSDIPNLRQSAAPMPRTEKPAHVTTGQGDDDDDIGVSPEIIPHILRLCAQHGISTDIGVGEALEELANRLGAAGDAGVPTGRVGAVDAEGLDDEVIEQVLKHLDGRMSPSALVGLRDMLSGGADDDDPMPAFVRGNEDYIARRAADWDVHSASDAQENREMLAELEREHDARAGDRRRRVAGDMPETASELMRPRGGLDPGTGERMAARRGTEPWFPGQGERVAGDMPPPFPGRPTPGAHPLPGRQERSGIDRKRMAGDAARSVKMATDKQFAKFLGLKKRQLPRGELTR
jgi:hypothetical protein